MLPANPILQSLAADVSALVRRAIPGVDYCHLFIDLGIHALPFTVAVIPGSGLAQAAEAQAGSPLAASQLPRF